MRGRWLVGISHDEGSRLVRYGEMDAGALH